MSMKLDNRAMQPITPFVLGCLLLSLSSWPKCLGQQASPSVISNIQEGALQTPRRAQPSNAPAMTPVPEGFERLTLSAGYLLQMDVYGVPEMSAQLRVDSDGDVTVPLIGKVHVGGLTVPEAQSAIAKEYSDQQILKSPQVTLNVLQFLSKYVSVLGEVQSPGRIQMLASEPLENVLALTGGETVAAGHEIEIQHPNEKGTLTTRSIHWAQGDAPTILRQTFVDPGDTVYVQRAGIIYVLGAVNRPGGYLMVNGGKLDIIQAVALAGGTTLQASTKWAIVVRRQGDAFVQLRLPLGKIEKGDATPIRLELNDALFVPTSNWKLAVVNSTSILSTLGAAAIYRAP